VNPREDSGCAGKDRHASRVAALAVAAMTRAALEPYACRFCGAWHLATPVGVQTRPRITRPRMFEKLRHHPSRSRPATARGADPVIAPVVTCPRGASYPSEIEAIRSARGLAGVRLRGFLCPCGAWHLVERRGRRG